MEQNNLKNTLSDFMNVTAKSTVAVVIPLYGYWADIPDNPVNGEVLKLAMSRLYSNVHQLYLIFVAHENSLPTDPKDPSSVGNQLLKYSKAGNAKFVPVGRNDSYARYIAEGVDYALNETKAQYVAIFNPWVMIQHGGMDVLVDRTNRADEAKVVSGYDLRSVIEPDNFDQYRNSTPTEEWDLSMNFMAMPRFVAEMVTLDETYQTHAFLERDLWQQVVTKGFAVIASQRVPIFPFDFPWDSYESKAEFEADRKYFGNKWRFDPGLIYQDPRGASRKDKTGAR